MELDFKYNREKWMRRYPAVSDLSRRAKKRLPKIAWTYLNAGTGSEELIKKNISELSRLRFLPRICLGKMEVRIDTKLFEKEYNAPFGIAPVGLTGLMWPKAEEYLVSTACRYKIPFTLSTVGTETPEKIGPMAGNMGWFQLYPPREEKVRQSLIKRAKDAGFHTLVVTADIPTPSRRESIKRAGLTMPPKISSKMIWEGIKNPSWTFQTLKRGLPRLRTVEQYAKYNNIKFVSNMVGNRLGGTLSWEYCKNLKKEWGGPVILKGIMDSEDALKAIDCGMDGIVVSNHGGRQFDGAPASIEVLPQITNRVKGQIKILFDGGVRTGLDIMRALYLGADFVLLGRSFIYGVAALGKYGGDHVTEILMEELKNNMTQCGVTSIDEIRQLHPFRES